MGFETEIIAQPLQHRIEMNVQSVDQFLVFMKIQHLQF